jgi:hypothetical protein
MARRKVMEATESHCVVLGGDTWPIRAGGRVMSHPAVAQNPRFFAEAAPDSHVTQGLAPEEAKPEPQTKSERRMRAKGYMRLPGIALPGGLLGAGATVLHEGDIVPASHPAVRSRPQNFERVK